MFDPVDPKQNFPALERGILKYWKEEDTFKRSIKNRSVPGGDLLESGSSQREETYSFYDGPPFATGLPHYGHLLAGTIKDVIPRYQTMRGKKVIRRFGWDCHGLPIENLIEQEHKIGSKKQIEEMGVKAFNDLCRTSVLRYTKEWRNVVERMGRWVDMDWDYRTMDPDYMESIWWVFNSLYDKKLIYEGHKPMHVCPRCVTPLSNFEVTQGYKDVTDVGVTVKFELQDSKETKETKDEKVYMLAWTTTPWTLPGNLFLAVDSKMRYYKFRRPDDNAWYIASDHYVRRYADEFSHRIEPGEPYPEGKHEIWPDWGNPLQGIKLIGLHYEPVFPYFADAYKGRAFRIVDGTEFVSAEEGTGVVHIATGFGEDDYIVGKREGIDPPLQHVTMEGKFTEDVTDFAGLDVKPADDPSKTDRKIAQWLEKYEKLFAKESVRHSYPHCWRCDSPLLNYATSSWFVAVEEIKKKMLDANAKTHWVPEHLRDGRFGKWLDGARDWAISRSRYWGTPLPIWRCPQSGELEVIGSRDELMRRCPIRFTKVTILRHGQSEGNVTPRYQGSVPGTPLTRRGREQAEALGKTIASEKISRIYRSPLLRCKETAEIIGQNVDADIVEDERIREVQFGEFEGKSVDFSDLTFVKARRAHKLETGKVESVYHFPGMESWSQVQARTSEFLREVLPRHRGEHIVIVTHADPALNMKHFFTGEDPAKLSSQPYPGFAAPFTFYWDHDTAAQLDLHKETVDEILFPGDPHETSVQLTIVRHGQTDFNKEDRVQGWDVDPPLNEQGKKQALAAAASLKGKTFDVLISSDSLRARQTAEAVQSAVKVPRAPDLPLLRERSFGAWSKLITKDIVREHPFPFSDTHIALHPETPPGAESLTQFLHRAQKLYDHVLNTYAGKKVLLVTHGGMVQALHVLAQNLNTEGGARTAPDNAQIISLTLHPQLRRVPEVLDCWFESGSMPYAQGHYPFEQLPSPAGRGAGGEGPLGFPADFIAEGIDQTRGWFYTLMVLSSALFALPAFKHCIVNGTVLAEDGKKMSKRLKNYPEPLEVVERHGADAVRFALMSSSAVRAEDLRFSEKLVEESLRSVLLPLWNTYAFFVTYANAAKWEPTATRRTSSHPLDQWIRAEVQDLVNRMTEELDRYDLSATCAQLHETIDALTNWYVRLSRRRFAGKAGLHEHTEALPEMHEQDRLDALTTLEDVLLTLSQLLAPFCPFMTEVIYLNLIPEQHGSVHFTDWPQPRALTSVEQKLLIRTRLLRTIAYLGLSIRSLKQIKLRQPLSRLTVAIPDALLCGEPLSSAELQFLQEEVNVHSIDAVQDAKGLADRIALVDAKKVGPRLGGRVQELIALGKRGDFTVKEDGSVLIGNERLSPEDVQIVYRGREGEDVAADKGIVVSVDTRMTPELKLQGEARDLIRAIQTLRKESGLNMEDRIILQIDGADEILKKHGDTILNATNAAWGKVSDGLAHTVELDRKSATVHFKKV